MGNGARGRNGGAARRSGDAEKEEEQSGSGSEEGSGDAMTVTGEDSDGTGDDASDTSPPSVMTSSGVDGSTTIPLPGASEKEWRSPDFAILVQASWRKEKAFRLYEVDTSETNFPEDTAQDCTLSAREW